MMKGLNAYLRRTLSFALAVCMVMSMTTPVVAEGECDHSNGGNPTVGIASCTTDGYRGYICTDCRQLVITSTIPASGHFFPSEWNETPATCTAEGVKSRKCCFCDATETEVIPKLEHTWISGVFSFATCTTDGVYKKVCTVCEIEETEPIKAPGHNWSAEWVVKTPATCTTDGVETRTCPNRGNDWVCDETQTQVIPALGHDFTGVATDSGDGNHSVKCSRCDETTSAPHNYAFTEDCQITEDGHELKCTVCGAKKTEEHDSVSYTINPTCTAAGERGTKCSVCDRKLTSVEGDAALGHSYGEWSNSVANNHSRVCARCSAQETENHTWDSGVTTVEASCGMPGVKVKTCTKCGATTTETITAPHSLTSTRNGHHVNGSNQPACANSTSGVHYDDTVTISCSTCGKVIETKVVCIVDNGGVSSTKFNGNSYTITYKDINGSSVTTNGTVQSTHTVKRSVAPTCGTDGLIEYACTNSGCQQNHNVTIPATGNHKYDCTNTIPSTCTTAGSKTYTCRVCNNNYTEPLALAAHTLDEGQYVTTKEPTCTETGLKHLEQKCGTCSSVVKGVDITTDALGHTEDEPEVENTEKPTCTENGSYDSVVYCSVCNEKLSTEKVEVKALGHKAKTGIQENFANATCTAVGGYDTVSYCEVCNKELERTHTVIPALGHAASELRNTRSASENAEGYTGDLVCPRCNETLTAGTTIPRLSTGEKVEIEPEVILEVLNEEIKLDTAAVEDLTVLAQENGNNALELLTTVNGTLNALEAELSSGRITPEEYARCVEVANVAVSVALTVGAKAGSAAQAAAEQSENLPADTGIDMGAIVGDFYQRQFDAILGKNQPAVHNTSAFDGDMSGIRLVFVADENLTATGIDLSVDPEVYRNALAFIDDSVDKMTEAAATLRSCSGEAMVASVKQYIEKVAVSVFRDFDKEAADEEFLQNAYEAILLNMQQQVSLSLTEAYEEASKSGKFTGTAKTELDKRYEEQMAAVADVETFEIMVLEVMRQKYVSVLNTQLEAGTITREGYDAAWTNAVDVETFEPIYWAIFRAWALNEESEYPMTLQELTDATIADTTYATTHIELRDGLSSQEIAFLTAAVVLFLLLGAAYVVSDSMNKRKVVA